MILAGNVTKAPIYEIGLASLTGLTELRSIGIRRRKVTYSGLEQLRRDVPWLEGVHEHLWRRLSSRGLLALGGLESIGRIRAGAGGLGRVRPLPFLGIPGPG